MDPRLLILRHHVGGVGVPVHGVLGGAVSEEGDAADHILAQRLDVDLEALDVSAIAPHKLDLELRGKAITINGPCIEPCIVCRAIELGNTKT